MKKKGCHAGSARVKKCCMHLHSFLAGQIQILLQPHQDKQTLKVQTPVHVMHLLLLVCTQLQRS